MKGDSAVLAFIRWRYESGEQVSMLGQRWVVGLGALLVAAIALYMVLTGTKGHDSETLLELSQPALDDIDAKSRSAMRDLLRDTGNGE